MPVDHARVTPYRGNAGGGRGIRSGPTRSLRGYFMCSGGRGITSAQLQSSQVAPQQQYQPQGQGSGGRYRAPAMAGKYQRRFPQSSTRRTFSRLSGNRRGRGGGVDPHKMRDDLDAELNQYMHHPNNRL